MNANVSRRCFLQTTMAGALSTGALMTMAQKLSATTPAPCPVKSKAKVGKLYLGNPKPYWPKSKVDLPAEARAFQEQLARLGKELDEYEFIEGGIIEKVEQLADVGEKFKDVDGILALQLTMGVTPYLEKLFELNLPIVLFAPPYTGHEWHTVASWQRQGKPLDVFPTSRQEDVLEALRPLRAIHRLKAARVLHVSTSAADAAYCAAVKQKFGTEIISLTREDLKHAYEAANRDDATADARQWIRKASKIVEPSKDEILRSSTMYVAMRDMLAKHGAMAITMNCLGMKLIEDMAYPCLGFVRLSNLGLGGVCEADLKSTMTHLIFSGLVGRPGFVTDPVFDLSNSTVIHAHCVAATQMEGPDKRPARYHIRSHLEDDKGASLMVKMPVGRKLTMARLIGTDKMLFATGEAVDSPFVERGCRTKLTMRVEGIEKMLDSWSCGLHRVVFYGDHSRDLHRYCRLAKIRVLHEGVDDLHSVEGLEWEAKVHA